MYWHTANLMLIGGILLGIVLLCTCCTQTEKSATSTNLSSAPLSDSTLINSLLLEASVFEDSLDYDQAIDRYQQALAIYEKQLAEQPDSLTRIKYVDLQVVSVYEAWRFSDQVDTSLILIERARNQAIEWFGEIHPSVAYNYLRTGSVYEVLKDWEAAKQSLRKAVSIYEALGPEYIDKVFEAQKRIEDILGSYERLYPEAEALIQQELIPLLEKHPELKERFGAKLFHELGQTLYRLGKIPESQQALEKGMALIDQYQIEDETKGIILSELGNISRYQGKHEQTIRYYEQAIEEIKKFKEPDHYSITNTYDNIALTYLTYGNFQKALELLQYSFSLKPPIEELRKYRGLDINFINFSHCYKQLGDYEKSMEYAQRAYQEGRTFYKGPYPYEALMLSQIGLIYEKMGQLDLSEDYYQKSTGLLTQKTPLSRLDVEVLSQNYDGLSYIASERKDFQLGRSYLLNVLELDKKGYDVLLLNEAKIYYNIATMDQRAKNFDLAFAYMDTAMQKYTQLIGASINQTGVVPRTYGLHFYAAEDYDKAIPYFEEADQQLGLDSIHISPNQILTALTGGGEKVYLFDAFLSQTIAYYSLFKSNNNKKLLFKAYNKLQQVDQMLEFFYKGLSREESKLLWQERKTQITEIGISIDLALLRLTQGAQYIESIFQRIETNKARVLREAVNEQYALKLADVPKSIVDSLNNMQTLIGYYDQMAFESSQKEEQEQTEQYQSRSLELKLLQDQLLEYVNTKYPAYYQLKYDKALPSITDIQTQQLSSNAALLEYFRGDSTLTILLIHPDTAMVVQQSIDEAFGNQIQEFLTLLKLPSTSRNDQELAQAEKKYLNQAYQLYQILIEPVAAELTNRKELIIIPDGELGYLPFDILLSQPIKSDGVINFKTLPYLIQQYIIQHEYAAKLLNKKSGVSNQKLLAFAPSFESSVHPVAMRTVEDSLNAIKTSLYRSQDLAPLEFNQPEVEQIQQEIGGKMILGKQATESLFKAEAPQHGILHLATHAFVSDVSPNYSHLVFAPEQDDQNDQLLYAHELYNMQLQADLAVLSACETGVGELERGEGIMSLSRAFKYAGCPNIVTSLWQAEDKSTQQIMVDFYKHLKDGKGKAEALQQAKLSFLNGSDLSQSHPFYWGTFILIGNNQAITFTNTNWVLIFAITLVGIIGMILFIRRNKREA